ncbi:MAG TPA: NADP-dependent oxidoreductase [Rhizomicrobium sp.]|nr:NADP-dependent oxidoreductase [Rhizomicrobium sp.]
MATNRQWIYARKPNGQIGAGNFDLREAPMPQAGPGEVVVRSTMLQFDAASRAWMQGQTYRSQLNPGDVMAGRGLGEVVESRAEGIAPGDVVMGDIGWQTYAALPARQVQKLDKSIAPELHLSVYGITGLTAYFGLLDVGRPRPGETVLVSAAAGAVGVLVGQIAKIMGCTTVGTTSGKAKCDWLTKEVGYDAAVDYRQGNIAGNIKAVAPQGIDVYFDNTGGDVLGAALARMNMWGRVACCGAVANYDTATPSPGPAGVPGFLVTKRIRMEGFVVMDFFNRRREAETQLHRWVQSGQLRPVVDIVDGFEKMPETLVGMFAGRNRGKLLVRI